MIEYWRGEIDRESAILLLTEVPENNVEFSLIRSYKIWYHLSHCSLRNEYWIELLHTLSSTFWRENELSLIFDTVCVTKCFRSNAELWKFIQACDSFWVACRNVWTSNQEAAKCVKKALSRKNASFPTPMQNAQRYWRWRYSFFSQRGQKNVALQWRSSPFLCVFTRLIIV